MRSKSPTLIQLITWAILTSSVSSLILIGVGVPTELALYVGCGAIIIATVLAVIETFLKNDVK